MSQSATFYPVDSNNFAAIQRTPANLDLLSGRKNYVTLAGTHEGLRFILSKKCSELKRKLVQEIFYPETHIGVIPQSLTSVAGEERQFLDVPDNDDYNDAASELILYHARDKVKEIASFLNDMSSEQLLVQFDPEELNLAHIYPCCWNKNNTVSGVYNEHHILEDYENIKAIFNDASVANNYLLCFVG